MHSGLRPLLLAATVCVSGAINSQSYLSKDSHPKDMLMAVRSAYILTDETNTSALAVSVTTDIAMANAEYILRVHCTAAHGGSHVFHQHFKGDSILHDGCFHVELGKKLTAGMYTIEVIIKDAYPSHPEDTLLASYLQKNINCCSKNAELSKARQPYAETDGTNEALWLCTSGACPTRRIHTTHLASAGSLDNILSFPGYNWWFDPRVPNAMHFYDLDG